MNVPLREIVARAAVVAHQGRPGADHEFVAGSEYPAWKSWGKVADAVIKAIEDAGMVIVDAHEPYAAWLERRKAPGPGEAT